MPDWLNSEALIALLTLTLLEIVLGIDNIVFIAILTGKLEGEAQQKRARRLGLTLAMVMRLALLLSLSWMMKITAPLFGVFGHEFSGRDLILLVGGLFLMGKATYEIHDKVEAHHEQKLRAARAVSFKSVIAQILLLDLVFSLDSVITAVGMARSIGIMMAAVIISVVVMLLSADRISAFIERHPTLKMLALSFLMLIGVMLVIESFGKHVEKGYIYFAMGFSLFVEFLNIRTTRKAAAR